MTINFIKKSTKLSHKLKKKIKRKNKNKKEEINLFDALATFFRYAVQAYVRRAHGIWEVITSS